VQRQGHQPVAGSQDDEGEEKLDPPPGREGRQPVPKGDGRARRHERDEVGDREEEAADREPELPAVIAPGARFRVHGVVAPLSFYCYTPCPLRQAIGSVC